MMSILLSLAKFSNRSNDNVPRLCGSTNAKCNPDEFKLSTILGIAELAGPGIGWTGAPNVVRRFSADDKRSGSASEIYMPVNGASDLADFCNACRGLPSLNFTVVRLFIWHM